jgi:hypothetical protein
VACFFVLSIGDKGTTFSGNVGDQVPSNKVTYLRTDNRAYQCGRFCERKYIDIQICDVERRGYVLRNGSLGDFFVARTCTYTKLDSTV